MERALQNPLLEAAENGLVWPVPISFKGNDRAWTNEGGNISYWGGSKTVFEVGSYGMFSPPLSFPTPTFAAL